MKFDVIHEPWIPVVTQGGDERELGIYELLKDAHRLMEIRSASPMIEYGIYRLLCAFVMDALRPEVPDDLENLLQLGQFDMSRFDSYLDVCAEEGVSFDLFDEKRPFLQSAYDGRWDKNDNIKPIAELDYTVPSGNNHVLFEHAPQECICTPAQGARLLCAINTFCTAGLKGPSSVNGAPPLYVIVAGNTLWQTLVYSIVPESSVPMPYAKPLPLWRGLVEIEPARKVPATSLLLGMTWPARRLRLLPEQAGENVVIRRVCFQKGLDFQGYDGWRDPHVAYNFSDKGRSSVKPQQGKDLWRTTASLLDCRYTENGVCGAPLIISQYRSLCSDEVLRLNVYGAVTNQAAYVDIQQSRLTYDVALTESETKIEFVKQSIELAENAARTLKSCLWTAARENSAFDNLILQSLNNYYARCQKGFWTQLCPEVASADTNESGALTRLKEMWTDTIHRIARDEYELCVDNFGTEAKMLIMQGQGKRKLNYQLGKEV